MDTPTPMEVLAEFVRLFQYQGMMAQHNPNGADSYQCPCCFADEKIGGYSMGSEGIEFVTHAKGCELYDAYMAAKKLLDADEEND